MTRARAGFLELETVDHRGAGSLQTYRALIEKIVCRRRNRRLSRTFQIAVSRILARATSATPAMLGSAGTAGCVGCPRLGHQSRIQETVARKPFGRHL